MEEEKYVKFDSSMSYDNLKELLRGRDPTYKEMEKGGAFIPIEQEAESSLELITDE